MGNKSRHLRRDRKRYRQLCRRVREFVTQARWEVNRWVTHELKLMSRLWQDVQRDCRVARWLVWRLEVHVYWDPYRKLTKTKP